MRAAGGLTEAVRQGARPSVAEGVEACYSAQRDTVYRWALAFGGGRRAWAEDVAQDVFVKLVEHHARLHRERGRVSEPESQGVLRSRKGPFNSLDNGADVRGWLYRVTANIALSRLRRERSWLGRIAAVLERSAEREVHGPDRSLELKEDAKLLLDALSTLPAKESVVVTMRFFDGKTQREIAAALTLSEGYVSKLLNRAVVRLRQAGWEIKHETS